MRRSAPRIWQHSVQYGFVRSRELERSFELGPKVGVYGLTGNRVRVGWGEISEKRWPYDGYKWPPIRPADYAELAARSATQTSRLAAPFRCLADFIQL